MTITTSYDSILQKLYTVNVSTGIKLGLNNMFRLNQLFDYPSNSFQSIHITGTNGKGSVATKIANGLQLSNKKTGLYTSPHLSTFRERIRLNGEMISKIEICHTLERILYRTEKEKIPATFFDITTLLSFLYFSNQKVDVAVIETGLGGRLDSTNIISSPLLTIITSVSLDHTNFLGSSLKQIAQEKAGIIKPGVPVIIGPRVPFDIIQKIAEEKKSPIIQVKEKFVDFEEENQALAKIALKTLDIQDDVIEKAVLVRPPCRFEILKKEEIEIRLGKEYGVSALILDVAHNEDGLEKLFQRVKSHFPNNKIRVVFALSKEKDKEKCVKIVTKYGNGFHLIEGSNGRNLNPETLGSLFLSTGVNKTKVNLHDSHEEAIKSALSKARVYNEIVVVCGSFFIMASIRRILNFHEDFDHIDMNEAHVPIKSHSTPLLTNPLSEGYRRSLF